jgi:uncharacterized LabA/DUF88 family protein
MNGVHVYVDGYNSYCGINQRGWLKYGWCNFSKLAKRLAERAFGSSLPVDEVKYYPAPVRLGQGTPGEIERQKMWLDALRAEAPEVKIVEGRFQKIGDDPRKEKETDVNIAFDMGRDIARAGKVILVSADSDFVSAVSEVREAGRPAFVFFPPNQSGYKSPLDCPSRVISKEDLADCRLQDTILRPGKPPILWSAYQNLRRQDGLPTD